MTLGTPDPSPLPARPPEKKPTIFQDIIEYYESSTSSSTPRKRLNPDPLRKRRIQKKKATKEAGRSSVNVGDKGLGPGGLIDLRTYQARKNSLLVVGLGLGVVKKESLVSEEGLGGG